MAAPELDGPEDDLEQGLFSHLIELRSRLLRAIVAVLVVLGALIPFANRLYTELAAPLVSRLPQGAHLIATEVASPFVTPLKLAFYLALFIAMPVVVYQLWAFVSPGLYRNEKRLARPLLVAEIFDAIQRLKRGGTTILLVEQNAHAALAIADRGYVIETGEIVLSDSGTALLSNERVRQAYLGL